MKLQFPSCLDKGIILFQVFGLKNLDDIYCRTVYFCVDLNKHPQNLQIFKKLLLNTFKITY